MENWYGVLLPAGTPKEVRDKLEQALLAIVAMPAIKQRFAEDGLHGALDHEAFAAMLKQEFADWPDGSKRSALPASVRHGRACPGHLDFMRCAHRIVMPGTRPGMTK